MAKAKTPATASAKPAATAVATTSGQASGRLAGKIALVTGAAGNLGGYIVRHYLAEGATVVMTGRTSARLDAAATPMRHASGVAASRLATVVLDGGYAQSVRDGISAVVKPFGQRPSVANHGCSRRPTHNH